MIPSKLYTLASATLLWTALASCSGAPPAGDGEVEITAEGLVDTWIEAAGGMGSHAAMTSARFTLTTEMYDTASGRLRRTRPRYVTTARNSAGNLTRIERWEGNDFIEQGWDGTVVWAMLNGTPLAEADKDFDEVPYVSGDVNYWIGLPFKLRDPGVNLHYRGLDEGRHLVSVSFGDGVGLHDGDTWRYWFTDASPWPVQVAYLEEDHDSWDLLRFEDVQTVDGYTYVGRRVHFNERGQITKVLFTHDFVLNPGPEPAFFSRP